MHQNTSCDDAATVESGVDELDDLVHDHSADPRFSAALADAEDRSVLITRLVGLRKEMNLTQQVVAARMGTTQSTISDFENGSPDYFISTAQRYARAVTGRLRVTLELPL